jgi:hypothetical protein
MKVKVGMMLLAGLAPALSLGGCSGDDAVHGFSSFATMPKPGTSKLPAVTTELSYTSAGPGFTKVTSLSPTSDGSGSVTLTVDAAGSITGLTIDGTQSHISFSNTNGDLLTSNAGVASARSADGKNAATGADYNALGYNYQTFGTWVTGLGTGSGNAGAFSAGAPTPVSSVPATGTATYNGTAGGIYVDSSGATFVAAGSSALTANFANHSVSYSTSGTTAVDSATGAALPNPSVLNMQGTLSLASGSNDFSGSVSSSSLNGTARGRFYGPTANEAGGTFALRGPGVSTYLGAFGAK